MDNPGGGRLPARGMQWRKLRARGPLWPRAPAASRASSKFDIATRSSPCDEFVMEPGYVSFQPVKRGQLLAHDRSGPVRAGESGRILLPLYQSQGADGFFLVREISPRWLQVSAWSAGCGWNGCCRCFPASGAIRIARYLIVDPRMARWLAVDLFHLLGYRRRRCENGKIVVSRRPHDVDSLSQW